MRKALILAYDFPPYNSIGGQRPFAWYKHLKESGIEPTIVTRHWDIAITKPEDCYLPTKTTFTNTEETNFGNVVRTPFKPNLRDRLIFRNDQISNILRKVLSFLQIFLERQLPVLDNKYELYREAREQLKKDKFDIIIATGEPFILFHYAQKLSKEFEVPWIADYRDGWSLNYNTTGFNGFLNKTFFRKIEQRTCSTAQHITVAAPAFAEELAALLNRPKDSLSVVYNGYFEEMFDNLEDIPEKQKFHIVHAGTLYSFQRVETFLNGLDQFLTKHPDAEMEATFFGLNFFPAQMDRIKQAAGKGIVNFTDKIPHEAILKELASSHLQLLVANPEKHQIYAKVFDYLASGRPTLLVENDRGPLEWILSHQENAHLASSADDVANCLEELYYNRQKTTRLPRSGNQFSRRKQTERLANLILEILDKQNA